MKVEIENFGDVNTVKIFQKIQSFIHLVIIQIQNLWEDIVKKKCQLHKVNKEFFDSLQYGVISHLVDLSQVKQCHSRVSAYFSLLNSDDQESEIPIIHQDTDVLYAGVIYLSENPDIHSGTCLYVKENDEYN